MFISPMFLENMMKRSIKQHASSLESIKVKLDKKFNQDPTNDKSSDEDTAAKVSPKKKKSRKFSRSELLQWDGPVSYRIPEYFKEMYKDALKTKLRGTSIEENTLLAILKHKNDDPIQEFLDRYRRPGGKKKLKESSSEKERYRRPGGKNKLKESSPEKERYRRPGGKKKLKESSPEKEPVKINVKKRKEREENVYTENDLKLNWKTLMRFCKSDWTEGKPYPLPKEDIDNDDRDFFFIGRSDIKGKEVFFIVSDHIIPTDKDSHIFPNSFFMEMQDNEEYEIPQYSKNELFEIVQYAIHSSIEYIVPKMVHGGKSGR